MVNQVLNPPAHSRPALVEPIDHELFLSKFGEKDRKGIIRHLTICEEKLGLPATERWRRFAHVLMAMAPHPAKMVAQQAIQFYIPDGKYRMQVFALQVLADGALAIYTSDILAEAIRTGILATLCQANGGTFYPIVGSEESLAIDTMDGQTLNPAPLCKGMTGWHRKAICITLPPHATAIQIEAAENLCALTALTWATAA